MNLFTKSIFIILLMCSLSTKIIAQVQRAPTIAVSIFDSTFIDLNLVGITGNTLSLAYSYNAAVPFQLDDEFYATWGLFSAKDFWPIYRKDLSKPTDGSLPYSTTGSYDIDEEGNYQTVSEVSAWTNSSEPTFQYKLCDPDLNVYEDLYASFIPIESHGVGFSKNKLIHYGVVYKQPYLLPDDTRDTMLYENIRTYNIQTGEDKQVFDYLHHAGFDMPILSYANLGIPPSVYTFIDRTHYNAIDDFPGENASLVSYRHNAVWKVNHTEDGNGEVAWILGGPPGWATAHGFREVIPKYEGQDLRLRLQHAVSVIDSSEAFGFLQPGDITVWDNGDLDRTTARALVIRISEFNGVVYGEVIWKMEFDYSPFMGSFRLLKISDQEGIAIINQPHRDDVAMFTALQTQGEAAAREVIHEMGCELTLVRVANKRVLATYTIGDLNYLYTCYLKFLDDIDLNYLDCSTTPEAINLAHDNVIWHYGNGDTIPEDDLALEDFNDERYFTYSKGVDQFGHETARGFSRKFDFSTCFPTGTRDNALTKVSILLENPVSNTIKLKEDHVSYILYSSDGKKILTGQGDNINVKDLSEGWYILAYITANQIAGSEKVIIVR